MDYFPINGPEDLDKLVISEEVAKNLEVTPKIKMYFTERELDLIQEGLHRISRNYSGDELMEVTRLGYSITNSRQNKFRI